MRTTLSVFMAAAVVAVITPADAQTNTDLPLAWVDPSTVPAGYRIVSMDGAGNAVIETTHKTILQTTPYPYSYNMAAISPNAPKPQFNITADGRMEWKQGATNPGIQGSRHVAGKTDLEAGLIALNDASNSGCTYVLCSWYGADSTSYAGPCAKPLEDLGRIVRNQGWQAVPACKGTSLTYSPSTCVAPWRLVETGDWQAHACRAMAALGPPPPPPPPACLATAAAIAQDFQNYNFPITYFDNGDGSYSVVGDYSSHLGTVNVNVQVNRNGCYSVCWSTPTPIRESMVPVCNGAQFLEALHWLSYAWVLANMPPGFDSGG